MRIVEVGPRDGLQNEKTLIPLSVKVKLIELLSATGLRTIEAGSFVSPKWVPQMADSTEIFKHLQQKQQNHPQDSITYTALTPNLKGLDDALKVGVKEVAVFGAASEAFSQKNINCSIAESLKRFEPLCESALAKVGGWVGGCNCLLAFSV